MIPGPCQLPAACLDLLGRQIEAHYGPAWCTRYLRTIELVRALLGAPHAYVLPGSGTAALDALLVSVLRPGSRVAVVNSGYFGTRLISMCRAHDFQVVEIPTVVGEPVASSAVAAVLPAVDAVLVTQVESATGVRHPVAELAAQCRASGVLCLVDAVASAGGEVLDLTAMGIDALATAPQKGLGAAPGLGIVALSDQAYEVMWAPRDRAGSWDRASWYLDLREWDHCQRNDHWEPHPVTMPTNLVDLLSLRISTLLDHGLDRWIAARAALAAHLRDGLASLGLRPVADRDAAANLVTAIRARNPARLRAAVLARANIMVGGGLAPLAADTFRIGLVGSTATYPMVDRLLDALRQTLRDPAPEAIDDAPAYQRG